MSEFHDPATDFDSGKDYTFQNRTVGNCDIGFSSVASAFLSLMDAERLILCLPE